jgi:hypothetical protein
MFRYSGGSSKNSLPHSKFKFMVQKLGPQRTRARDKTPVTRGGQGVIVEARGSDVVGPQLLLNEDFGEGGEDVAHDAVDVSEEDGV